MPPLSSHDIGRRIRDLREKYELSQQQLADVLKIPRQSVSLIEQGKRDLSVLELNRLAEHLQIPFEQVLAPAHVPAKEAKAQKRMHFSPSKLRNLLLYILEEVGGRPNIGETVIYKLLYFCDFNHFERTGKSITGLQYRRLQYGPVPQRNQFEGVINDMKKHDELEVMTRPYHGKEQVKYVAFADPDIRAFSSEEKKVVDDVLRDLGRMNASEIEEYSHGDVPWIATQHLSPIDYDLVHMRTDPYSQVTEDEKDRLWEQGAISDMNKHLDPLSKEEIAHYESLPDLRDA